MEKLTLYRKAVTALVEEYGNHKMSQGEIDTYPVIDTAGDHHLAGWDGPRRVQGAFHHLDIIGDKVWIQFNGTDQSVAAELVAAGVAKEDIVLGDKPARVRPHTGYGVG
jgi:hypothetical protein